MNTKPVNYQRMAACGTLTRSRFEIKRNSTGRFAAWTLIICVIGYCVALLFQ